MTTARLTLGITCLLAFTTACPWEPWQGYGDEDDGDHDNDDNDDNDEDDGDEDDGDEDDNDDNDDTDDGVEAVCGDGHVDAGEECDDLSGRCSEMCTRQACEWDLEMSQPIKVWMGQAVLGEIAFDSNCNLMVGGGEEAPNVEALYRVDKNDGSVSVAAGGLAVGVVAGITYNESDGRIYFSNHELDVINQIYALDDQGQLELIVELDAHTESLAFAPEGFGDFGGQIIAASYGPPQLLAINTDTGVVTPFAQSTQGVSVAKFGNDGTLYVAETVADRISTVTADGVITPFCPGINAPYGLAIAPDGTRMFVSHPQDGGRIDQISIPGGVLTPGSAFENSPQSLVVDGTDRVLYEMSFDNHAAIGVFDAP